MSEEVLYLQCCLWNRAKYTGSENLFTVFTLLAPKPIQYSISDDRLLNCVSHPACLLIMPKRLEFHSFVIKSNFIVFFCRLLLDGEGPVDNRPSTDKLHQFVRGKKKNRDMWHVICDMWHMTCDTWHVTHDTWHVWWGEDSLKISAP